MTHIQPVCNTLRNQPIRSALQPAKVPWYIKYTTDLLCYRILLYFLIKNEKQLFNKNLGIVPVIGFNGDYCVINITI